MPGMGFLYGTIDKAKQEITKSLDDEVGTYTEIWNIIDEKWDKQLHRDLHTAAYYLNPQFHYDDNFYCDVEVKTGLFNCLDKLIPNIIDREKANLQLDTFRLKQGLFGYSQAVSTCKKRAPGDWWVQFGDEAPELRNFAVKVLSLTCASSACERNWSSFNQVHTKKRNRLTTSKLNSLVYIMYNKKLKAKYLKKKAFKDDEDPLVFDYVPSDDEWIAGEDDNLSGMMDDLNDVGGQTRMRSGPSGGTEDRPRAKRKISASKTKKDRGKKNLLVDEENEWEDISTDDEDDRAIRYHDDSTDDPSTPEDYDEFFKPLDTEEFNKFI